MSLLQELASAVEKGKKDIVMVKTQEACDAKLSPAEILNDGLIAGMMALGERWKRNEVFVPEVLIAARALKGGLEVLTPILQAAGVKPIGKAIICTVKGDLHDIGKNLVAMMIVGSGLEVVDLGVDVSNEKIIAAIAEHQPDLLLLSALLTTTMPQQKEVIDALVEAGVRDSVKIMIGGAPVTQAYADEIGADAFTPDAVSAAEVAKAFVLKKKGL
ncbi:MAG: cobalamin B12-binding domain-containing protein [Vallitaleaceae bacterium]|nr:cobalamin B12-binding domain-containing protein [Vallitaleaceae bacterium]